MKKYKIIVCAFVLSLCAFSVSLAHAAAVPSLSLNTNGVGVVQVTVLNADPNATAILNYPSNGSYVTINLGVTNSAGNLSMNLNTSTYNITSGTSVYVTVDSQPSNTVAWPDYSQPSNSSSNSLYLNQTNVTVGVGQSTVITASAGTSITVSNNTNSTIAGATIAGNQVIVYGYNLGTANITLCAGTAGCSTITVNVTSSINSTVSSNISLSQSSTSLIIGQNQAIPINGSGGYTISNNSSPNIVAASLNNGNIDLTGLAFGSSNITICQSNNTSQCVSLYVYVSNSTTGQTTQTINQPASLSSFTVSSNNFNSGFMSSGNTLTITFSVNQNITNPSILIGTQRPTVSGTGSGPYTATYTMNGTESVPLPVTITFTNSSGSLGQAYFSLGGSSASVTSAVSSTPSYTTTPTTSNTNTTNASYSFLRPLGVGSTGDDVMALQQRLTNDGFYTGPISGTYGPLTEAAVKQYQAQHNLNQLGIVGPATRGLLNQGI